MKKYVLTLRVNIEAEDDPQARSYMKMIGGLALPLLSDNRVAMKLQEVYPDKPPRKVNIEFNE